MHNDFSKSQQAGNQNSEENQQPPSGAESVCAKPQALRGKCPAHNSWGAHTRLIQSAIAELQAPAWSCLAEPSPWTDTKRERAVISLARTRGYIICCGPSNLNPGIRRCHYSGPSGKSDDWRGQRSTERLSTKAGYRR